jgi:hypothetical protein
VQKSQKILCNQVYHFIISARKIMQTRDSTFSFFTPIRVSNIACTAIAITTTGITG